MHQQGFRCHAGIGNDLVGTLAGVFKDIHLLLTEKVPKPTKVVL